jgi:hypothetical protein
MSQANTKKQTELKVLEIDNHDDFNAAVLEAHTNIDDDPYPVLEVSERFFNALAKGKKIDSLTFGHPGVRVFKTGTADEILDQEKMPADRRREIDIRKISEAANK